MSGTNRRFQIKLNQRRTTADTYVTFIHISFTDHAYIRKNNPSKYTCTSVYGMSLKVIVLFNVTFSVRLLLKDMEYVFIKYHHQQISNLHSTFYSLQSESCTWFIVKCNAP